MKNEYIVINNACLVQNFTLYIYCNDSETLGIKIDEKIDSTKIGYELRDHVNHPIKIAYELGAISENNQIIKKQ